MPSQAGNELAGIGTVCQGVDVGTPGASSPVALSYIVPAYNGADGLEATLKELGEHLDGEHNEIVVVENGSTDNTLELARSIEKSWQFSQVELRVLSSEKGLGNALRMGIAASRGAHVVLTADDLPFGFDDLDQAKKLGLDNHKVFIGSKAHPDSAIDRSLVRAVLSTGFLVLRLAVLGMRTRDPQGTFVLNGEWARGVVGKLTEPGFLLTTELAYLAEQDGIRPVEVPVRLRGQQTRGGSTINVVNDAYKMGIGLFKVRAKHRKRRSR